MEPSSSASHSLKYDFYQTESKVIVTVLVKHVAPENVKVNFTAQNISASIKLPSNEDCNLNLNLAHTIVPNKCSFKVTPSKIEISLTKESGIRWNSLECKDEKKTPAAAGPKSWDAIVKTINDKDEESSVSELFSTLYSQGTDEQKRAMEKSFYESGGTVLSTDWKDVGKKKVEVKPPEGVEFKPW